MQNKELMQLADQLLGIEVNFVQVAADNQVYDRRGVIISVHIGADRRFQVRLADAGGQTNADLASCELNAEERHTYLDNVMRIRARADEIKKAQADLVTAGNNELEKIYDAACGLPKKFEVPPISGPLMLTPIKAEALDNGKVNSAA